jgi:hypothetical protein
MEYKEAVAEARRLVRRSEEDQWRLAELTWEQVEAGRSRRQWAQDIGVSADTTERLYKVWARWSADNVGTRPRFADAWAGEKLPAVLEGHATARQENARQAVRNMPPEQKAEVVREALAEPEVAERIVRDTPTRAQLSRAEDKVDREMQHTAKERYELNNPRSVQIGAYADLSYALTKARTALEDAREAADTLAANQWPDRSRENAEVLGQRVHAALELYWATVRGEQLDAELQALLEGGDA